ncbi:NAD(P)-dependent oxidoreductase [Dellaglioa algida]|uniref:NAD(P)-dependent oxidoreductase n=1 Tax=Dellaglioa algida TaxID=105612 RepID=UPI0024C4B5AE|nr:NAD(P)-dependent oxidoreductase [Dellaglioa algida]MDK1728014.1 NAD(P)-dependent oxidoreductase [Dellaglioa algida]MDK1735589.1 NAD(P)-dependent oxidoreductase [Dellaglioa algida]MDK1737345.1 NAD(P)-dependent oxidoreductase [Dellaglioa algida]
MKKIGFVGTGVMGAAIVSNLLKADYEVRVFNRTKSKTDALVSQGAIWADSPQLVAAQSDITFSMVGFPTDVDTIYFEENGIFAGAKKGSIVVDMTTSTPTLAKKIGDYAEGHDIFALDAPVSGGDIGAKNAKLTIMVGGHEDIYEQVKPIFEKMGTTIALFGGYGSGQHAKMANQIMIAGTMTGMTELLVYAKAANLDLESVIKTVGGGSAANWSLANYAPRILKDDYTPGFFAKHFLKDLRIALDEAEKMDIDLPSTKEAKRLYEKLVDEVNLGNDGTQALIKLWWK